MHEAEDKYSAVITGLVPVIPLRKAVRPASGGRVKPGNAPAVGLY